MGTKRTPSTREPTATATLPARQPSGRGTPAVAGGDAVASPAERRGLECRACGCRHFEVLYTRPRPGGIMRVRQCRHCGKRLVTRETAG